MICILSGNDFDLTVVDYTHMNEKGLKHLQDAADEKKRKEDLAKESKNKKKKKKKKKKGKGKKKFNKLKVSISVLYLILRQLIFLF